MLVHDKSVPLFSGWLWETFSCMHVIAAPQ